jgi:hypothetical protein
MGTQRQSCQNDEWVTTLTIQTWPSLALRNPFFSASLPTLRWDFILKGRVVRGRETRGRAVEMMRQRQTEIITGKLTMKSEPLDMGNHSSSQKHKICNECTLKATYFW